MKKICEYFPAVGSNSSQRAPLNLRMVNERSSILVKENACDYIKALVNVFARGRACTKGKMRLFVAENG